MKNGKSAVLKQNSRTRGLRHAWKPGQSGNPAGRPKGSRNKLGEAFLEALLADFSRDGVEAIQKMRAQDPSGYIRVVASVLPKDLQVTTVKRTVAEMSDEELLAIIQEARDGETDSDVDTSVN